MKMKKAMKKLKFWSSSSSKKKKDQKSSCHCHYQLYHHWQYYPVVEPSAPPLPSSYNPKLVINNDEFQAPFLVHQLDPFQDNEYQVKNVSSSTSSTTSYQQYMDPNPVFDVPVEHQAVTKRERDAGAFGCVFSYGVHLFRCFFPCFHIKHVD